MHFAEELNDLHDLDEAGGAHEMNALLSLVLSMGQNRAAGSLRFEPEEERALAPQVRGRGPRRAAGRSRDALTGTLRRRRARSASARRRRRPPTTTSSCSTWACAPL